MVFTFGPEWCSVSLRNPVQLSRNPHTDKIKDNSFDFRFYLCASVFLRG
jgi:hypothetical protein